MWLERAEQNEWDAKDIKSFAPELKDHLRNEFLKLAEKNAHDPVGLQDRSDATTIALGINKIEKSTLISALTAADSIDEAVTIISAIEMESQKDYNEAYKRWLEDAHFCEEQDKESEDPDIEGLFKKDAI